MKLFSVHCGYYDEEISNGIYEFHVNLHVAAQSVEEAKTEIRENQLFMKKKMHIDGIEEIKTINGYGVQLVRQQEPIDTIIHQHLHREL